MKPILATSISTKVLETSDVEIENCHSVRSEIRSALGSLLKVSALKSLTAELRNGLI